MNNPFDELRKRREESDAVARKKYEISNLQQQQYRDYLASLEAAGKQLDPMIQRVLEQLRQAAYPRGKICFENTIHPVHDIERGHIGYSRWTIQREETRYDSDGDPRIEKFVDVAITLCSNVDQKSLYLKVWSEGSKPVVAGLSEKELILTLQKLHQINN